MPDAWSSKILAWTTLYHGFCLWLSQPKPESEGRGGAARTLAPWRRHVLHATWRGRPACYHAGRRDLPRTPSPSMHTVSFTGSLGSCGSAGAAATAALVLLPLPPSGCAAAACRSAPALSSLTVDAHLKPSRMGGRLVCWFAAGARSRGAAADAASAVACMDHVPECRERDGRLPEPPPLRCSRARPLGHMRQGALGWRLANPNNLHYLIYIKHWSQPQAQ